MAGKDNFDTLQNIQKYQYPELSLEDQYKLGDAIDDAWRLSGASHAINTILGAGESFCKLPEIANMTDNQSQAIQLGMHNYAAALEQATKDFAGVISENLTITPETVERLAETPEGRRVIGGVVGNQDLANSLINNSDFVGKFGATALNAGIKEFANSPVHTSTLTISGLCDQISEAREQFAKATETAKEAIVGRAEDIMNNIPAKTYDIPGVPR